VLVIVVSFEYEEEEGEREIGNRAPIATERE
jgi:hypothetical protein